MPHLTKDDCSVSEDKVPQTLKNFNAETHLPLTLGILLDTSGSQIDVLPLEQQAGSQFLERVLKSKDQAFLLSFDVNVDLLQDFTNSARMLSSRHGQGSRSIPPAAMAVPASLASAAGPIPTQGAPKGTLLYDAIYLASNEKMAQQNGRKAMIILTDGDDQGSDHKIQEAIAAAQKANTIIYVILIADPASMAALATPATRPPRSLRRERRSPDQRGHQWQETRGRVPADRGRAPHEYLASYTPTNAKQDGTFRHVSVQCKGDDMKVQVRRGYYAPAPEGR